MVEHLLCITHIVSSLIFLSSPFPLYGCCGCFPEPDHKGQAALEPYYCFKHKLCNSKFGNHGVLDGGLFCRNLNTLGLSAKSRVLGKKLAMVLHVAWNNRAVSCNQ